MAVIASCGAAFFNGLGLGEGREIKAQKLNSNSKVLYMHKIFKGVSAALQVHNFRNSECRLYTKYITKIDQRQYGFPRDKYTHMVSIEVKQGINKYMWCDRITPDKLGIWVESSLKKIVDEIKLGGRLQC